MEIKVLSRSKARREFVHAVARYAAQELGIHKSKAKINISLVYRLKQVRQFSGGLAVELDPNGAFDMYLDSRLGVGRIAEAVAHEMVHVKQRLKGALTFKKARRGGFTCIWYGKVNLKHYKNQPWEIEARKREKKLGNKIIDIINAG